VGASRANRLRRWAPWIALAIAAVVVLAVGSQRHGQPTLAQRTMSLAAQVRCPVCAGQSAAQSNTPASLAIRDSIRQKLQAGEPPARVLDDLVGSYGPGILEKPPARGVGVLVWVLPVALAGAATLGLGLAFARWQRPAGSGAAELTEPTAPPDSARAAAAPELQATVEPVPSPRPKVKRRVLAGLGVVVVAGATVWTLHGSSASRAPGQVISGQAVGPEVVAQLLVKARDSTAKGDAVGAIKDYQQILSKEPDQVEALTGEGWLLAQTQQPALLAQGLQLLSEAERADPGYLPARFYRGIALLSQGDNAGAIPELQYYLDHGPDPQLAAKVRDALAKAQAAVAAHPAAG